MEISRQNYEQYFVDYLDGKLNNKQVDILLSFLEFNPDLKEEFDGLEKMFLSPDETNFTGKARLLKSETDLAEATILKDFDMYCISSMENDIADEEEEILQGLIGDDPDRKDTYLLYQSTRLIPDDGILFQGKEELKKRIIPLTYRIILPAAAAVAALLILLQVFTFRSPESRTVTQSYPSTETFNDINEVSSLPEKVDQTSGQNTTSHNEDNSAGITPLNHGGTKEKGSYLTDGYTAERESIITREKFQLNRIASKPVKPLRTSNAGSDEIPSPNLALRQSGRLQENGNTEELAPDNPKLSLWILADAGVRGLNSVAEDEYHLDRVKDKSGKTRRITFDTPVFGISAPLRKPDKKQ